MRKSSIPHIRRPAPMPIGSVWRIDCDCGWRGEVLRWKSRGVDKTREEAEAELNHKFVAHLPPAQRQTYVLVDQTLAPDPRDGIADPRKAKNFLPRGNWIMPEGKGCNILEWGEKGGVYSAKVRGYLPGDPVLELPVGEVRTADGKVYRLT
jgi:hypothetical protein